MDMYRVRRALSFLFSPLFLHSTAYVHIRMQTMLYVCKVKPYTVYILQTWSKTKKKQFPSCALSHSTAIHFAATCSINQGRRADIAGTQAELH